MKAVKGSLKWNRQIGHLPLLSSECPGWVCYAEKTLGEEALPFMSKVKSPQQLCGRLLKVAMQDTDVRFVTIMPCYDKKLEAVRPKLQITGQDQMDEKADVPSMYEVMEVDTVLASHEVLELLDRHKTSLSEVAVAVDSEQSQ